MIFPHILLHYASFKINSHKNQKQNNIKKNKKNDEKYLRKKKHQIITWKYSTKQNYWYEIYEHLLKKNALNLIFPIETFVFVFGTFLYIYINWVMKKKKLWIILRLYCVIFEIKLKRFVLKCLAALTSTKFLIYYFFFFHGFCCCWCSGADVSVCVIFFFSSGIFSSIKFTIAN